VYKSNYLIRILWKYEDLKQYVKAIGWNYGDIKEFKVRNRMNAVDTKKGCSNRSKC